MTIDKKQLAAQLSEAATLLELLGEDPFRARAFAGAARNVEAYDGDIARLLAEDRLVEVKGIGKSLALELAVLKTQDTLPLLERLYEQVPAGVRGLLRVSGLGVKKVAALWQAGVADLEELIAALEDGRVAALPGFGKKSAEKVLEAARFALGARARMRLDQAALYAAALVLALEKALPGVRVAVAGSLRRGLETVADIDLVVSGVSLSALRAALPEPVVVVSKDEQGVRVSLEGREAHIAVVEDAAFGAVLALWTGGEAHREALLERAQRLGYVLDGGGLSRDGVLLETPQETDLYTRLDLPWAAPERREVADPEPRELIEVADVRGLVHNHSSDSDAAHSLREMVTAARTRGYAYLAMADHSRASYYANGLSIERVYAQAEEVREIRRELEREGSDFALLHGLEVDILSDGSLDYPDEVLATLDYTVVSVHQNFTLSEAAQTERLVRAVHSPYASILGHATGRLLLKRPPYAVNVAAVIAACAETKTVVEINANPHRLDLDWRWVIRAKEAGCLFSINPDAHHKDGYDDVRYGVLMARKAGLSKDDVVNTAPTAEGFLARLKRRP